jgi:hypothetical protein
MRYILYAFFLFSTTQAFSGSNPEIKFIITLLLIVLAEKLFKTRFYVLFALIIINRLMVSSIDLTEFLYTVYDPSSVYYFMIELFEFNRVFYLVATHICFVYLVFKKKEPNVIIPILATIAIYAFSEMNPELNYFLFSVLYGFGFVAFLVIIYFVFSEYSIFSHRVMGLMCVYFVYSSLLIIKHINQTKNILSDFNLSYAYILVLLLATLIIVGNEWVMQNLLNKYFILFLSLLSTGLAFVHIENTSDIMQHIVFVTLILFIYKVFVDVRKASLKRYNIPE